MLGFGIEQREDPIGRDLSDADNVTRPVITDLAKRWDKLEQVARINLEAQLGSGEAPEGGFRRGVRTRRDASEAFLADVVQRHNAFRAKGLPPTQSLAREERVSPSTVKHWLRKAREAGVEESARKCPEYEIGGKRLAYRTSSGTTDRRPAKGEQVMTDKLVTYQLTIQGGSDVVLRLLPSDLSIIEPVERVKDVLDLVEDRVEVKVYEEDPTGHSKSRELTPDEAEALEDALERALGSKVKVQPHEAR